jgi:hypothetical protein
MRFKSLLILALPVSLAAYASPYADELGKCLVDATTKEDRTALVRWMFAAAAAHPAVAAIANVSPKVMEDANATTGALITRLLTESCKDQAKKALNYEGPLTLQLSFQVLGQVAATELFTSPQVKQAMSGLEKTVDKKKLEELKSQ